MEASSIILGPRKGERRRLKAVERMESMELLRVNWADKMRNEVWTEKNQVNENHHKEERKTGA